MNARQRETVEAILAAADKAGVVPHSNVTQEDGTRVIQFVLFPASGPREKGTAVFTVRPDGSGRLSHPYRCAGIQFADITCLDLGQVLERIAASTTDG